MLDNICSLPVASDVFALAIHPSEHVFTVGLAAGHVETFRLPGTDNLNDNVGTEDSAAAKVNSKHGTPVRRRRVSETGFDMVESGWRTRRHKGSCRALAYSWDGETLYSAGTDGLVKAAMSESGRVTSKTAIKGNDPPSVLRTLSPSVLLLGTDTGRVLLFDLRANENMLSGRPSQSLQPHQPKEGPPISESISSVTPLQPTLASTSMESRMWITTSGSTLAASDLRKGVISISDDQNDELLSSVCLTAPSTRNSIPRSYMGNGNISQFDQVIVGGLSGAIMTWDRGSWEDRKTRFSVDEFEIEQLAVVPDNAVRREGSSGFGTLAAGISNGHVAFLKLGSKGSSILGEVSHDDRSVDGITALGFDVSGRMISCGGRIVKLWHRKSVGIQDEDGEDEDPESELAASNNSSGSDDSDAKKDGDDTSALRSSQRRRKRKRHGTNSQHDMGSHGVMGLPNLQMD